MKYHAGALSNMQDALDRLATLGAPEDVLRRAPAELGDGLGLDRVAVSRLRGSVWVPGALFAAGASASSRALRRYWATAEIPLARDLIEAEVARRGRPVLVRDAQRDPRTEQGLMRVSRSPAYVVAPIFVDGRVAGFVHADRLDRAQPVGYDDRDLIAVFAGGVGRLLARAAARDGWAEESERLRGALALAARAVGDRPTASFADAAPPGRGCEGVEALPRVTPAERLLTQRERDVLDLLVSGATNAEIARRLALSEETVKSHLKSARQKLRAADRAAAASKYLRLVGRACA
jgi:DNA-binding CsgD family transcriptional regulator